MLNWGYLYLSLRYNVIPIITIDTVFAAIIGGSPINNPYTNQQATPRIIITRVANERSFVCLDFMALIDWGRNANVVSAAPVIPMIRKIVEFSKITY